MSSEKLSCFHAITGWDTASTLEGRGDNSGVENSGICTAEDSLETLYDLICTFSNENMARRPDPSKKYFQHF